jgi:hypothetical protein
MVRRSRRASGRRTIRHSRHLMKSRRVRRMRHTRTRGRRGGVLTRAGNYYTTQTTNNPPSSSDNAAPTLGHNTLSNVADQYHGGPYPGGEV